MLSRGFRTLNNATHCTPPRLPRFLIFDSILGSILASIFGSSVLDRYAIEIVAFELLAGGIGGFFVEAGEAGAIERLVALEHALGERIGGGELVAHFGPRRAQMLLGLVFARIGADLDQPAAAGADLRRRFGLCRLGFDGFGFCGVGLGGVRAWRGRRFGA